MVARDLYAAAGPPPLRLFAGQPDPDDPTHFTITWELPGEPDGRGILDGWVREGSVRLEKR